MALAGPDPIDVHVGGRVRLARMATGLTQGRVGNALGISTQQVQKYEKGLNRLGASKIYRLAKLLDVSVEFFFEGAPEETLRLVTAAPADGSLEQRPLTQEPAAKGGEREVVRLVRAFLQIPDRELRSEIVSLVTAFSRRKT